MKLSARLSVFFFSFLLFFLTLFLLSPKSFAQYSLPNNNSPDVPRNLNTYSQNLLLNVLSSFSCVLTGINPLDSDGGCLGYNPQTKKIGYVKEGGGALLGMASLIGMTYDLPIHTSYYTDYLTANFGLVKNAYAQSPGYTSLQPLVKVWIVFRDFAYLLFVLVFVIIGVAIMLRIKIDPRTVMTIQNSIPKIIIGLVLVTLSFAIAGLLIDFMWLVIFLIINIFSSVDPQIDALKIANNLTLDPINYLRNGVGFGFDDIWEVAKSIGGLVGNIVKGVVSSILGGVLGWLVGGAFRTLTSWAAMIVLPVVLFFALFRLWFTLIQSFIMILINVIFAPLWILAGLLPSKQTGFGGWVKSMLANLSVFPIVALMFILGKVFIDLLGGGTQPIVPMLGDTNPGSIRGILALGVILLTPNVANMTKAAFKSPNMNLGAIFKPVGAATSAIGQTVGRTSRTAFFASKGTLQQPGEGRWTRYIRGTIAGK